jgi:hypothetical protein
MNPLADGTFLANQGILFWIACAAVALGLTMVIVAAVVQTRRLAGRRVSPAQVEKTPDPIPERAAEPATLPSVTTAEPVRRRFRGPDRMTRETDRLVVLLSRLEEAAGRLEAVAADGPNIAQVEKLPPSGDSNLKDEVDGVEYVFRAAGG